MVVVIILAAVIVIAAVVWVGVGRGGQLSVERGDYLPLDLGPVSATDVALLRPPTSLWGYNRQATDEAMERVAESIRERDVRIVALEQLVTDLGRDHAPATAPLASPYGGFSYPGARHRRTGELPVYRTGEQPAYRTGEQPMYRPGAPEPYRPAAPEPYRWEGEPPGTAPAADTSDEPPPEQAHD